MVRLLRLARLGAARHASRIVDEAWHQFILDSKRYTGFCEVGPAAVPREVDGWLAGFGGTAVAGVGFAMVDPSSLPTRVSGGGCGGGGS
ncbi:MAG: hypothetical protein R2725_15655 [Solirubrobacterales bacterium]